MQIADTTDVGFPNKERQKDVGLLWLILLKKSQKTATCHALSGTAVDLHVLYGFWEILPSNYQLNPSQVTLNQGYTSLSPDFSKHVHSQSLSFA